MQRSQGDFPDGMQRPASTPNRTADVARSTFIVNLTSLRLQVFIFTAIAAALILGVGWSLLDPAPPRTVRIATGVPGGFYDALGKRYRAALQKSGVAVELVETSGSVENVRLLLEDNDIDISFVQGGITRRGTGAGTLRTLASLAIEPLWIFSRTGEFDKLEASHGVRIAAGPMGSGTRDLVTHILSILGLRDRVVLVDLGGQAAADALMAGDVDYAAFVTSPKTDWIQQLLIAPGILLTEPGYARSLVRVLPFATEVQIPARVLDFQRRIPRQGLTVLGVATSLVVTPSAHPAIKHLLLAKSHEIVDGEAILGTRGQFPSRQLIDFPLDEEAMRYFQHGPTPVRRYLPYWLANLVERFWFLVVPILTLLIPLLGFGPTAFDWSMRRRIYRWYRELADIETAADRAGSRDDTESLIDRLDALQERVKQVHVSLAFRRELYALRAHIAFVRQTIARRWRVEDPGETHPVEDIVSD